MKRNTRSMHKTKTIQCNFRDLVSNLSESQKNVLECSTRII